MPYVIIPLDEWLIIEAARRSGCKAEVVRDGGQLVDDGEAAWTIGEEALPNLPDWKEERNSKPFPY